MINSAGTVLLVYKFPSYMDLHVHMRLACVNNNGKYLKLSRIDESFICPPCRFIFVDLHILLIGLKSLHFQAPVE